MKGYVQRYEYIKDHKAKVKEWFQLNVESPMEVLPTDFVVSIRRGWNGWPTSLCPPKEFFLDVFDNVDYKRIILCTDSFDDPYDTNEEIEFEADNILDFTESNPFGDF